VIARFLYRFELICKVNILSEVHGKDAKANEHPVVFLPL